MFLSTTDLGIYSATFKIFLVSTLLLQSMNLVFSPWIVESKLNKNIKARMALFKKLLGGYFLFGVLGGLFLFLIGPFAIKFLFGIEFSLSQQLIKTFSLFLIPVWPVYSILVSYMNNFEKDKTFFFGALIQIVSIAIVLPIMIFYKQLDGVVYGITCLLYTSPSPRDS